MSIIFVESSYRYVSGIKHTWTLILPSGLCLYCQGSYPCLNTVSNLNDNEEIMIDSRFEEYILYSEKIRRKISKYYNDPEEMLYSSIEPKTLDQALEFLSQLSFSEENAIFIQQATDELKAL